MSDLKQARAMLAMAHKDLDALRGMQDQSVFADEIFGFHAQQAIEKSLKAWIASYSRDYPLTHNIVVLLSVLEEEGADIGYGWSLVKYNAFAVQFRYEQMHFSTEDIDRSEILNQVTDLVESVDKIVA